MIENPKLLGSSVQGTVWNQKVLTLTIFVIWHCLEFLI
jgi:hypothetical protein